MSTSPPPTPHPPQRQIRAHHDAETITLYQAYNSEIATAAVRSQKLNASPRFRPSRMTWVKPSWNWMMYRSGYARKDANQERILALRMRHEDFVGGLLGDAVLTMDHGSGGGGKGKGGGGEDMGANGDGDGDGDAAGDEATSTPTPTTSMPETKEKEERGKRRGNNNERKRERQKSTQVKIQWDPERTPRLERLGHRSIQIGIPASLTARWIDEWIVGIEDVTDRAHALERELAMLESDVTDRELVEKGLVPVEREYLLVPEEVRRVLGMD